MSDVRFSIVIPTRQRHETLYWAIKTCLAQTFDDFELIVSDNCSSPETKDVVESFQSPKIKYVRSEVPLAMTGNFELGVSHAQGEYVIVLGDDDGLLPFTLKELDRLIQERPYLAYRWELIFYNWPNMTIEPAQNRLIVPIEGISKEMDGEFVIQKCIQDECAYAFLPMSYYGCVHRSLIQQALTLTGKVFDSRSPDVYSGMVNAYLAKQYYYVGMPLSISALSAKSNGAAHLFSEVPSVISEFSTLNQQNQIVCHPTVPEVKTTFATVADSFNVAKDALFPQRDDLTVDRKNLAVHSVATVKTLDEESLHGIRKSFQDSPELLSWFNEVVLPQAEQIRQELQMPDPMPNTSPNTLLFDAQKTFHATNVYETSLAVGHLLTPMLERFRSEYMSAPEVDATCRQTGAEMLS